MAESGKIGGIAALLVGLAAVITAVHLWHVPDSVLDSKPQEVKSSAVQAKLPPSDTQGVTHPTRQLAVPQFGINGYWSGVSTKYLIPLTLNLTDNGDGTVSGTVFICWPSPETNQIKPGSSWNGKKLQFSQTTPHGALGNFDLIAHDNGLTGTFSESELESVEFHRGQWSCQQLMAERQRMAGK